MLIDKGALIISRCHTFRAAQPNKSSDEKLIVGEEMREGERAGSGVWWCCAVGGGGGAYLTNNPQHHRIAMKR